MRRLEWEEALRRFETPFYLFDTHAAARQVRKVRDAVGEGVPILYAMKANPFLAESLQTEADGLEACSPGEFRICERAGVPPEKIVYSGVCKTPADWTRALERGGSRILNTVESSAQWAFLTRFARERGIRVRALLRLSAGNQFGMDEDDLHGILDAHRSEDGVDWEGIQFYSGTQKRSAARMQREFERLDTLCAALEKRYGQAVRRLEFGPGLPVGYFLDDGDEEETQLAVLAGIM